MNPKDPSSTSCEENITTEETHTTSQEGAQDLEFIVDDSKESSSLADAQMEIIRLEKELTEEKDKCMRALAEIENLKRRAQKELENAHKFAVESLVKELITVLDSFDGAKQTIPKENEESLKGINLIEDKFIQILTQQGVEIIHPSQGDVFQPEKHQAMSTQQNPDFEPNQVIEVFQRGFSVKGRLIRPAMLIVSS